MQVTVFSIAQASSVDSAERVRKALTGFVAATAPLQGRSGIWLTGGDPADLVTVSAMVAAVTPFNAWVDGTSSADQGGYPFVNDVAAEITFDDGEAAVTRTDRVIAQVRHDVYDASGFTDSRVTYLKGQASGDPTALPASSMLIWEVDVPAGASAGTGGINFGTARVDRRSYAAAPGAVVVCTSSTRPTDPATGLTIFETDTGEVRVNVGDSVSPDWRLVPAGDAADDLALPGDLTVVGDLTVAGVGQIQGVRKSGDTSRSNDVTPTADPHLVLPVVANSAYIIDMVIFYDALAAADIRTNWVGPTGSGYRILFDGIITTGTALTEDFIRSHTETVGDTGAAGNGVGVRYTASVRGTVTVGATAGNFEFHWAQLVSSGTATRLQAGSYMRLHRVA